MSGNETAWCDTHGMYHSTEMRDPDCHMTTDFGDVIEPEGER